MNLIKEIFELQKSYYRSNETKNIDFRLRNLYKLKEIIKANESLILNALRKDLGKSDFEGYATEIGIIYEEINLNLINLKKWAKPKKVKTPIAYFKSESFITYEPYGVSLIIGPFNYPFHLVISPLIGAIAAGNCAIIKPSENSVNTALLLEALINSNFNDNYIKVVNPLGGKETIEELLDLKFDFIFFTGSPRVGKIIMKKASENLIPTVLELGGKSPCIVDSSAKIDLAAKRIVWGKFLNAGQTCVAPDYILVHKKVKEKLVNALKLEITKQFGSDIKSSPDYPRIINEPSVLRLKKLIENENIVLGGDIDIENKYFSPTLLLDVDFNSPIMQEEIFGPILPIIEYEDIYSAIDYINDNDKPLALYHFSERKDIIDLVLKSTSSGGATINDTVIQAASSYLPFGGVSTSGLGSYHGIYSFKAFSHERSIVKRSTLFELPFRFAPYKDKLKLIKKIMK